MEMSQADMGRTLTQHMAYCEKRGARLERVAWWGLGIMVAVLGVLLKAQFHIGG
jgi:hypothetical protein